MWHASVAIGVPGGMKPLLLWTEQDQQRAEQALRQVLRGVGTDPTIVERSRLTLHWRRKVTPKEHAIVGPAIDVRTPRL